jgi:hypothetical protein
MPWDPISKIQEPGAIFIGSQDQLPAPAAGVACTQYQKTKSASASEIIDKEKHVSYFIESGDKIEETIPHCHALSPSSIGHTIGPLV